MYSTLIISKVYELKEKILNSDEYKIVKEKEKIMEENAMDLLMKYSYLVNEYNQAKRFENYGGDVNKSRKELSDFKIEFDNNEYIKGYNKAYKNIRLLLKDIQNQIFENIIEGSSIII